jgi:predicted phage baseplate assembly protein
LRALLDGLNAAIATQALYEPTRFAAVALSAATQNLLALQPVPGSTDHERLNRSLLEDAYPAKLRRGAADLTIAVGGGVAGNVGALRPWEPFSDQPGPAPLALNIVMGEGGAESETLDAARLRAATELRRPARAVIADDFVALARTTPGVAIARAHAAVGYHPDFPCLAVPGAVTVFIVPDAPREDTANPPCPRVIAPLPDAGALAAVAARLEVARLIGNEIYVRAPIYRRIAVTVAVQSSFSAPDALRGDITARLQDFLDPLIGGDDKNGWPFGEPIRPSVILREAEAALNQRGDVVSVSMRLLDVAASTDESCKDTVIGAHALVRLETVTIRISALPAGATGGLQ